jgi:hypothetical protein
MEVSCLFVLAEHLPAAAKQRVGEVLVRNGAKQVAAPLRTVCSRIGMAS